MQRLFRNMLAYRGRLGAFPSVHKGIVAQQIRSPCIRPTWARTAATNSATSSGKASLIDIVKEEHFVINTIWDQYTCPNEPDDIREELGYTLVRFLSIHAAKEEEVIYPVLADKEGAQVADHALADHQKLKVLLQQVNTSTFADQVFDTSLQEAIKEFNRHAKEEEEDLLPRLERAGVDMQELASKYEDAEAHAPTRPHPDAPNKPPLNIAAHMATAPLDAAADLIRFKNNPPKLKPERRA